jgi:hypothetical protein
MMRQTGKQILTIVAWLALALTARGEALVKRLSSAHLEELRQRLPELRHLLEAMADE